MFKNILIQKSIPRDTSTLDIKFNDGLKLATFFCYYFMIAGVGLFFVTIFVAKMYFVSFIFLVIVALSILMLKKVKKKIYNRKEILIHGEVFYATVQKHGRQMNAFKSVRDYNILVQLKSASEKKSISIANKRKTLWETAPIGSEIIGLTYQGKHFFGESIGCKLKIDL